MKGCKYQDLLPPPGQASAPLASPPSGSGGWSRHPSVELKQLIMYLWLSYDFLSSICDHKLSFTTCLKLLFKPYNQL